MALFEEGKFFKKAGESSGGGGGGGGGDVDYNRVVEKTASALPTPTAALNGKAYMYVGETDMEDNTKRNGAIYECTQGIVLPSVSSSFVSQTISNIEIWNEGVLLQYLGFSSEDATAVFTYVRGESQETVSPTDGEEQGIGWSIPDSSAFLTAVHAKFSGIDFYGETPVAHISVNGTGGAWTVSLLDSNWNTFPDTQEQTISDPNEIGLVVNGDVSSLGWWEITVEPAMTTPESWQYNGATVEDLGPIGIDISGTPSNGDTITVVYTAATEGYIWKPVDNKYFKFPPLLGYTNEIIQYIGFGDEKGRFYQAELTGSSEPQYSIVQTAGTELSGLGMGWESWKFGDQLGWPHDEVDVAFKFIEATQTTGNVTYNLTNIQATIDLNTFYSALVEITTVDMANMYKPEYTDGWQIAVKDPNDNWSIIAQSIDPAHWGITITSGTPVAWQDSIEVYFTALGSESWEEYVDGTLFKSVPAKEWGIVYSGTPEAGVELLGHYTPASETYEWKEIKNIGGASKAVTKQLTVDGWQNNEQTVSDFNFSLGQANALIVTPTPESMDAYVGAGIMCISHNDWSVTFSCKTVPSVELTVNIAII